jgi:hypothetical protein
MTGRECRPGHGRRGAKDNAPQVARHAGLRKPVHLPGSHRSRTNSRRLRRIARRAREEREWREPWRDLWVLENGEFVPLEDAW